MDSRKTLESLFVCAAFLPTKLLLKNLSTLICVGKFLLNISNVCELNLKANVAFDFFISLMRHVAKVQIYVFLNSVGKADQKLKPTYDINGKEL